MVMMMVTVMVLVGHGDEEWSGHTLMMMVVLLMM